MNDYHFEIAMQTSEMPESQKEELSNEWFMLNPENEFELDRMIEIQTKIWNHQPIDPMRDINRRSGDRDGASNFNKFLQIKDFYDRP